jgi:hypothetical protein
MAAPGHLSLLEPWLEQREGSMAVAVERHSAVAVEQREVGQSLPSHDGRGDAAFERSARERRRLDLPLPRRGARKQGERVLPRGAAVAQGETRLAIGVSAEFETRKVFRRHPLARPSYLIAAHFWQKNRQHPQSAVVGDHGTVAPDETRGNPSIGIHFDARARPGGGPVCLRAIGHRIFEIYRPDNRQRDLLTNRAFVTDRQHDARQHHHAEKPVHRLEHDAQAAKDAPVRAPRAKSAPVAPPGVRNPQEQISREQRAEHNVRRGQGIIPRTRAVGRGGKPPAIESEGNRERQHGSF